MKRWYVVAALALPSIYMAFYLRRSGTAVFLISLDTVRADRLGCYGYSGAHTEFMDSLAGRGTVFENAITSAPFTPPSHASIFTGLYPDHHGVRFASGYEGHELKPGVRTLAEMFKAAGFTTAAFISARPLQDKKLHLGRGFDFYDDAFVGDKSRQGALLHQRRADETLAACSRWISQRKPDKLFVFIHLFDAHDDSVSPPPSFVDALAAAHGRERGATRGGRRTSWYDVEIAWMDSQLKGFFESVSSLLGRSALQVAILADHGQGLGDHGYKFHHGRVYQEQLRVPLIWFGRGIRRGGKVGAIVRTVDILPTFAELDRLAVPSGIDGSSLVPMMKGTDTANRVCYSETLQPLTNNGEARFSIIKDHRKLIYNAPVATYEYYDLAEDPRELNDLAPRGGFDDLLSELRRHDLTTKAQPTKAIDRETEEGMKALGYLN